MNPTDTTDDAQRRLERQALRNVRGLLDKVEREDARPAGILLLGFVVVLAVIALIVVAELSVAFRPRNALELPAASQRSSEKTAIPASGAARSKYRAAYVARVESFANANYPRAIRGMEGIVELSACIRADGSLGIVEITKRSGNELIDQAAINAVRGAAPFPAFSEFGLEGTDVLCTIRLFHFEKSSPVPN